MLSTLCPKIDMIELNLIDLIYMHIFTIISLMFKLQQLRNQFKLLFIHENSFHPMVFLIQCVYISLFKTFHYETTVIIFSIASMLLSRRMYFFYSGVLIQPSLSGILSTLNLVFGFLSCNEYWKLILLIYVLINFFTIPYDKMNYIINMIILAIYSFVTYHRLIFRSVRDNIIYFVGFCGLFVIYSMNSVIFFLQLEGKNYQ